MRKFGTAAVAMVSLWVLLPVDPAAAATCTFNASRHRVVLDLAAEAATISVGGAGEILVDGVPCDTATTADTDVILVAGMAGSGEHLTVDLSRGPFEPGFTSENSVPEIEIEVTFEADEGDVVTVQGGPGPETIAILANGFNLNDDGDRDVATSGVQAFTVRGGGGADRLLAERGVSIPSLALFGQGGNDVLQGGSGHDQMFGGAGDDVLSGGPGNDLIDGSQGTDRVSFVGAPRFVRVILRQGTASGWGTDAVRAVEDVTGTQFNDMLTGDKGPNRLIGRGGADILAGRKGPDTLIGGRGHRDFLIPGPGKDVVRGGAGKHDLVTLRSASGPVKIDLSKGTVTGQGPDTVAGVERAVGSDFNDVVIGSAAPNQRLVGGKGNDVISGLGGNDRLIGGLGNDILRGGPGADELRGSAGNDVLYGQNGNDSLNGGKGTDTCFQGPGTGLILACEKP